MSLAEIGGYFGLSAGSLGAVGVVVYLVRTYCLKGQKSECVAGNKDFQISIKTGGAIEQLEKTKPETITPEQLERMHQFMTRAIEAHQKVRGLGASLGAVGLAIEDARDTSQLPPRHPSSSRDSRHPSISRDSRRNSVETA